MWIRTQEGDLVNLEQMEWIVIEEAEPDEDVDEDVDDYEDVEIEEPATEPFELRAYQAGWNADAVDASAFYTLASAPDAASLEQHLRTIQDGIAAGTPVIELPGSAPRWA